MTKLTRVLPWIGVAFAVAAVASTMRRKGVLRGGLDAALDATPLVGVVKMLAEKMRGRDFISDRPAFALRASNFALRASLDRSAGRP